jgi:hypothetical protein
MSETPSLKFLAAAAAHERAQADIVAAGVGATADKVARFKELHDSAKASLSEAKASAAAHEETAEAAEKALADALETATAEELADAGLDPAVARVRPAPAAGGARTNG